MNPDERRGSESLGKNSDRRIPSGRISDYRNSGLFLTFQPKRKLSHENAFLVTGRNGQSLYGRSRN